MESAMLRAVEQCLAWVLLIRILKENQTGES